MSYLLDTHAFLWFIWSHSSFSASARALIADPANQLFLSMASCWEIAIKSGNKKLMLTQPCFDFLVHETTANQIQVLSIRLEHLGVVENLPMHHRDPFDRLLVAQALVEKMPIISGDALLDQYGVQRVW